MESGRSSSSKQTHSEPLGIFGSTRGGPTITFMSDARTAGLFDLLRNQQESFRHHDFFFFFICISLKERAIRHCAGLLAKELIQKGSAAS